MTDQSNRPQNPVVLFKKDIGKMVDGGEFALPSNVSIEAFKNAAIVAVQENPSILSCDRSTVFRALRSLAGLGLVPDGREAALVPFSGKCQAMPMVAGLIKSARRSGDISDIRAHLVYQSEVDQKLFRYVVGDEERLEHEPVLFGNRGPVVAAYAIAKLKDSTIVREFMSADEIDRVRRAGASQKGSEKPKGVWADWYNEMAKKTVIRRLCKRLDLSAEDRRIVMSDPDFEDIRNVTPAEKPQSRFQQMARGEKPEEREEFEAQDVQSRDDTTADDQAEAPMDLDLSDAFPGSPEYGAGQIAAQDGEVESACPHDPAEEQQRAVDWLAGFRSVKGVPA